MYVSVCGVGGSGNLSWTSGRTKGGQRGFLCG